MIEAGRLYIAQPPLYRIQRGRNVRYAFDEDEKDQMVGGVRGRPGASGCSDIRGWAR